MSTIIMILALVVTFVAIALIQGLPAENRVLRLVLIALSAGAFSFVFNAWFFGDRSQVMVQAGQAYRIPDQEELKLPVVRDVVLEPVDAQEKGELFVVANDRYQIAFSSLGAMMVNLMYSQYLDGDELPLETLAVESKNRERGLFMLALDTQVPLRYRCEGQSEIEEGSKITFTTSTPDWHIEKTFIVHKDRYQIDLFLDIRPRSSGLTARPKLFVPSPDIAQLSRDRSSAAYGTADHAGVTTASEDQIKHEAWAMPTLFGVDNTYTIHSLVKDTDGFVRRGYFTRTDESNVTAILEGPRIDEHMKFSLSFYVGPKSVEAIDAVEPRLEALFGFGWLSWLSKLMLRLLQELYRHVHNYGLAIIILALLLKLLLMPLSIRAQAAIQTQARLQPRMAALRKTYAHDARQLEAEMMRLYREMGMSPFAPLYSVLMLIVQGMGFFALQRVLYNVIDLYHAPLGWWITDLSAKDPYYIIPVCLMILMFVQALTDQSRRKAGLLGYALIAILSSVFAIFPVGLLLAIVVNMVGSVVEQKLGSRWYAA